MANINSGQSVQWDVVPGAVSYDVELLNASLSASLAVFNNINTTSITAAQLLAGQAFGNYNVRVRAVESAGPGAWSTPLGLNFVGLPAPTNLQVV